jgi:hypothetical protein
MSFPVNRAFGDDSIHFRRRQEDKEIYMKARGGDWLEAPFQCEHCWFFNLHQREPSIRSTLDQEELYLIKRVNLDMFWSRAKSTVDGHRSRIKRLLKEAFARGRPAPFELCPPWKIEDGQGMGIALLMLTQSLEPGRNDVAYTQFDTCRNNRSIASNIYAASSRVQEERNVLKSRKGETYHLHSDPMQSVLMERFVVGMQTRMPEAVKRNIPISGAAVAAILNNMTVELATNGTTEERRRELVMAGSYMCIAYGGSLRGCEALWVCGDNLRKHIDVGRDDVVNGSHVVVPLIGKFKGEMGTRMHVIPLANETSSGVKIRWWLERLVDLLREEAMMDCPAFCDSDGYQLRESDIEKVFQPILEELIKNDAMKHLWPRRLAIREYCRCFRSFRRGAENEALNNGVKEDTIKLVNRWRAYEQKRGKQPGFDMMHHYAYGSAVRRKQLTFSVSI